LGLFASPRFVLVRLVSVSVSLWVSFILLGSPSSAWAVWVSLFGFICFSFTSSLFGLYYGFHLFSWVLLRPPPFGFHYLVSFVSPSPRLCLVFTMGVICSPGFSFVRLRLGFIIRFAWFSLFLLRHVFVWFHSFSLFLLRRVFVWFLLWVSSVVGSCVSIAGRTVMSHRRMRAQI